MPKICAKRPYEVAELAQRGKREHAALLIVHINYCSLISHSPIADYISGSETVSEYLEPMPEVVWPRVRIVLTSDCHEADRLDLIGQAALGLCFDRLLQFGSPPASNAPRVPS